jgi:hypothetical protein
VAVGPLSGQLRAQAIAELDCQKMPMSSLACTSRAVQGDSADQNGKSRPEEVSISSIRRANASEFQRSCETVMLLTFQVLWHSLGAARRHVAADRKLAAILRFTAVHRPARMTHPPETRPLRVHVADVCLFRTNLEMER